MNQLFNVLLLIAGFILVTAFSYGMARLGEPQAVWMWRDMLGVL